MLLIICRQAQQRNPALLLRAQISRSNVGQVAHVSPTPRVASKNADITRRNLEAACCLGLGCWSNNVANSHPSPGPFDCRVLRSCLVPQCSYPPYWPHHQPCLANCDWMPASYTSGQPSNPRRHPTCWASLPRSHTISSTPCHGAWNLLHSALTRPSGAAARHVKSRHPFAPAAQQLISFSDNNNIRAAHWADHQWNAEWADSPTRLRTSISDPGTPTPEWPMTLPRRA